MPSPFCSAEFFRRSMTIALPLRATARVEATGRGAAGAFQVALAGSLELSGLAAEWIVRYCPPSISGGVRELRTTVALMAPASGVPIPRTTARGTAAERSTLWLEFIDGRGHRLGNLVYLGRQFPCTRTVRTDLVMSVTATAHAIAPARAARPAARLEACGGVRMAGVAARLALSGDIRFDEGALVSGPYAPHLVPLNEVPIILAGETLAMSRQPVSAEGPTDPWLSVQWRHGNGAPIGSEQMLGRCSRMIGVAST